MYLVLQENTKELFCANLTQIPKLLLCFHKDLNISETCQDNLWKN